MPPQTPLMIPGPLDYPTMMAAPIPWPVAPIISVSRTPDEPDSASMPVPDSLTLASARRTLQQQQQQQLAQEVAKQQHLRALSSQVM